MAAYRTYMEEQRLLAANNLDVKLLSRALNGFIHRESLCIDHTNGHIGVRELIEAFGVFRSGALLIYDCEYIFPVVFRALSASKPVIKSLTMGREVRAADGLDRSLDLTDAPSAAYELAYSRCSPRPHFPALALNYSEVISVRALNQTYTRDNYRGVDYALRELRELKICDMEDYDRPASMPGLTKVIRTLIGAFPFLTTVILELRDGDASPMFRDVFPSYHWLQHLRKLHLYDFHAKESHLVDFFRVQSVTLVDVYLVSITITNSDWSKILTNLHRLPFPRLEEFLLSWCFKCVDDQVWVEDFLLHETDKDSFIKKVKRLEERSRATNE